VLAAQKNTQPPCWRLGHTNLVPIPPRGVEHDDEINIPERDLAKSPDSRAAFSGAFRGKSDSEPASRTLPDDARANLLAALAKALARLPESQRGGLMKILAAHNAALAKAE
jgi:hypothetical protein